MVYSYCTSIVIKAAFVLETVKHRHEVLPVKRRPVSIMRTYKVGDLLPDCIV